MYIFYAKLKPCDLSHLQISSLYKQTRVLSKALSFHRYFDSLPIMTTPMINGESDSTVITDLEASIVKQEPNEVVSLSPVADPSCDEISPFRETLFLFIVALAQMFTQAGVAQTTNAPTEMAETFGVAHSPGEVAWFTASFSLTVGTFILISGRLGDLYGYKMIFVIGFVWYGVWSLVCGFSAFASSSVFFDVMRALQGIGPALTMPNATALIGHYYPTGPRKGLAMCLFGSVAPLGFVIGALFSGIFTQLVWWPWLFWVGGMICFVVALSAFFIIPKDIGSRSNGKFDWIGSILGVSGLVLINFAFNQGPNVGWKTPYVYILLIVGFLFMALFLYSCYKTEDPLMPPEALKGETGAVLACIAAGWSCFGIWLYYSFRWSELVDHTNPIMRPVHFIPCGITGLLAAGVTFILLPRVPSSIVMFVSMVCFLAGVTIMGTRPVGQIYWAQKFVSILILPFGMDMSFPAACLILSDSLPRSKQGIAGSLVSTMVNYSIALGLGLAGTVEYYQTRHRVPSFATTIHGYRSAFYMGMGLAFVGVLVSLHFIYKQVFGSNRQKKTVT